MAGAAEALAAQMLEATQVLHDPRSVPQVRQAANEFVMQVVDNPMVVVAATLLAGPDRPPEARFFAFKLIAGVATKGGLQVQGASIASQLCVSLLDMLRQSSLAPAGTGAAGLSAVPPYVREKFAQALAAVVVHGSDWPSGQPQLQREILEAGRQSAVHAALALTFFRDVCEVLQSDSAARLSAQHRKALQKHIIETSGELFGAVGIFTGSFPNCPELERAAVLLAQELSIVVPVARFLAADMDKFLHRNLSNSVLRPDVLKAFTDLLTKDIAKDLHQAPDRMKQFLFTMFDLTAFCQPSGSLSNEDYDVHKAVAMLLRDFVEANKPSIEKNADLQAKVFECAVSLMRYPSVFMQMEAASMVPHVIRAGLHTTPQPKGGGVAQPPAPPAWLRLKNELLPLIFLSLHKQIPADFDLFPLPAGYQQVMAITSEFDMEEDLTAIVTGLKCRCVEIMKAMTPAPRAVLESLEFVHELLPRVLGAAPGSKVCSLVSFEAALGVVERIMPLVKPSAGVNAIEACRMLLVMVIQAQVPGPEHERRRLEFVSRVGAVFDLIAEHSLEQGSSLVVQVFVHFFKVIEEGSFELRTRALHSFIGVSKAAPKAIRPVLEDIITKAAGLLQSIPNGQHVLCESLVTASTAAKNFDQQANLLRNLLSPILARWTVITDSLVVPEKLVGGVVGDRTDLDAGRQMVLCLEGCFRASTVPSEPAAAAAGGFSKPITGVGVELNLRNPVGEIAASVFPKLIALTRTFHLAFPSDMTRPMTGVAGATAEGLRPYLLALDKEELRYLTSSLDAKGKDEKSWDNAFPPPAGEDRDKVYQGRHNLYLFRLALYACIGNALTVQDGVLNNPELSTLLISSLIECMEFSHPYHLEMQLRQIWLVLFGPSGMSAATEPLRLSLATSLLPALLSTVARTLDRYWQWLQLPQGHPAAVDGDNTLLWAMCTGTVMASRTFMELVTSLVLHGGVQPTHAPAKPAEAAAPQNAMEQSGGNRKKGKNRAKAVGEDKAMGNAAPGSGAGHQGTGFAGSIFATPVLLEAVQAALRSASQWKDAKTISHALLGMQTVAVRLMSGGEVHDSIRASDAASKEAPQRCALVLHVVLPTLVSLCNSPPSPPPGDGALFTIIGKPFADFFTPENQQGRVAPSPFALSITAACWPIVWGICQIFIQVCKQSQVKAELQHIVQFPAFVEACKLLATLKGVAERDVQNLVTTLLEDGSDAKVKRGALRTLVRSAVDAAPTNGEILI